MQQLLFPQDWIKTSSRRQSKTLLSGLPLQSSKISWHGTLSLKHDSMKNICLKISLPKRSMSSSSLWLVTRSSKNRPIVLERTTQRFYSCSSATRHFCLQAKQWYDQHRQQTRRLLKYWLPQMRPRQEKVTTTTTNGEWEFAARHRNEHTSLAISISYNLSARNSCFVRLIYA
jgi:hypothetical protein